MILAVLNSTVVCADILTQARNQGSGLSKVQLFEYRRIYVPDWTLLSRQGQEKLHVLGIALATAGVRREIIAEIDAIISSEIATPKEASTAMYRNRIALNIEPR
jgi:hypothetical protein